QTNRHDRRHKDQQPQDDESPKPSLHRIRSFNQTPNKWPLRKGFRGKNEPTPVSQHSNSIGVTLEESWNLGNKSGFVFGLARPWSHVVAEETPSSESHGKN